MTTRRCAMLLCACLGLSACEAEPPASARPDASPATTPAAERSGTLRSEPEPGPIRAAAEARLAEMTARRDARRRWWNDEKLATAVGIDVATRQAMDAMHEASLQRRAELAEAIAEARREYRQAIRAEDLARARAAAQRRAEHVAQQSLAQQALTLDLLESLAPAQRRIVLDQFGRRIAGDLDARAPQRDGAGGRETRDR
jgi:hypothetical protein